ncbi:tilS, partial [Symbiodinium sp. KB8]
MLRAARAGWHAARCGVRLPCRHLSLLPEGQPVSHETFAQLMEQLPEHGQVPGTDPVAVAVSGGPDSMALAFLAHNYLKQLGVPSVALCVDHGLRQSSADEARLVADTVASWGMVAKVKKLKWEHGAPETGKLQELAREQRQQAVAAMAANVKAKHVLFGHQADDNIETFLMRLGRASGTVGLGAMSSVAALTGTSPVKALRPLLQVPRSALRATCEHHGIPFVDDPSNNDSDFDRVRAREAGLGLPRQGDGPTEAPSKEDVLELAAFLARSRSETEDAVDAVLARSTSAVLRWGAMKVDVAALLHGPGSRSEKQAALRRVVEVMSGRGKAVRASSAENVFAWLEARHAEYVETRDALHAMRVGERRSTPTQRNELRSALTRVLDVQTSLGGCILAPLRPQRLREKLPGTDTFARSTPNLQAPMELIVSPERSNRYSMVGSPGPATEEAAPKLQPN